jgi:hypothetical protein
MHPWYPHPKYLAAIGDAAGGASKRARTKDCGPAARPLQALSAAALAERFSLALTQSDGLAGAHCVHEQCMRVELPARIEAALEQLWQHAASSIPDWLPMRYVHFLPLLYQTAARYRGAKSGRSNVYLVLLDYGDRGGDPFGVYVGMSGYSPSQRFDQHKAGIRAAGSVLKRGLEVLTGPTLHLQRIARAEALRIEAQLAAALSEQGLLVQGGH